MLILEQLKTGGEHAAGTLSVFHCQHLFDRSLMFNGPLGLVVFLFVSSGFYR